MNDDMTKAHQVMRESLREIKASESTMRAAEVVIARREAAQQTANDQKGK